LQLYPYDNGGRQRVKVSLSDELMNVAYCDDNEDLPTDVRLSVCPSPSQASQSNGV